MLRYCSDCTILISFSGHDPVMVLFLSVYLYGTIIANPHIRSERLLQDYSRKALQKFSFSCICQKKAVNLQANLRRTALNH